MNTNMHTVCCIIQRTLGVGWVRGVAAGDYNLRLKLVMFLITIGKFTSKVLSLCIIYRIIFMYIYINYVYNNKKTHKKQRKTKTNKHFAWLEQISFAGNSERRSSDKSDHLTNSSYNIENNKNQKCIHLTNNNNSATTPGLCKLQQKTKTKKQNTLNWNF